MRLLHQRDLCDRITKKKKKILSLRNLKLSELKRYYRIPL